VAFSGATIESLQIVDCTEGIDAILSDFVRVSDCSIITSAAMGIDRDGIVLGESAHIERCVVSGTSNFGISILSGTIRDCEVRGHADFTNAAIRVQNQGAIAGCTVDNTTRGISGSTVTVANCLVRNASGTAYELGASSSVSGCTAVSVSAGFVAGTGSTLTNCSASSFQQEGFDVGDGCSLSNCTASNSPAATATGFVTGVSATFNTCSAFDIGGNGFETFSGSSYFNCTARNCDANGFVCSTGTVLNGCSARGNGVDGFNVASGSRIVDCSSTANGNNGFQISVDVHILNCSADDNTGVGINAAGSDNRIEGNNLTDNLTGLQVVANGGCLIIGNSASGNTTNFNIPAGNQAGPIGSAVTATSPWANLAF
jgi:parallel beta-helix repeat protein